MTTLKDWKKLSDIVLNSRFRQKQLLTEDDFLTYCKERDLNATKETLQYLRKINLFKPVFLLLITSGISLDYTSLRYYIKRGLIIPPNKKSIQEKEITNIYHPYQIILLQIILGQLSIILTPPYTLTRATGTTRLMKNIIRANKKRMEIFTRPSLGFYLKLLMLLFSVEGNYLPDIRKNFSNSGFDESDYSHWYKYHKKYRPKTIMKKLNVDEAFIRKAYEQLDVDVHFLDPLSEWYSLIRYFPIRKRECLRGKALLAQLYYEVLDILRALSFELSSHTELQGYYERETQWLGKVLGKEINYERYDVLEYLLNSYGINPSPKVFVYVEGETEYAVINKLLEKNKVVIENVGIKMEILHGVGGFNFKRLSHHLDYLLKNKTDCFFILDREGKVRNEEGKLKNKFPCLKDKIFIWKNDFEKDNFTKKEIAEGLSEYSKSIGSSIIFSENDVAKAKTLRNLFCGRINNCPKMLTCDYSHEKVSKCSANHYGSDKLNKPEFGLLMTSKYLLSKTLRKNHPSIKKGIIKLFNQILGHATSRKMYERP